jgi:hypothetical protein
VKSRRDVDPDLHVLRTAVGRAEGRERAAMESARFNLYTAFEQGSADEARRWARALRAGLLAWQPEDHGELAVRTMALEALGAIEQAIEVQS